MLTILYFYIRCRLILHIFLRYM